MGYDVVIAGVGAAGCVVASRLSEDPKRSVLLLEAGPDYPDPTMVPPEILSIVSPAHTHDWGYTSEPSFHGRSLRLPRGKLVGGCSATNAAIALRGAEADYDEWAAFGRGGPLPIGRGRFEDLAPVHRAFLEACREAGYREVADHNAPAEVGAGPLPLNALGGVRQSTALTYLAPARVRPNLTVRGGGDGGPCSARGEQGGWGAAGGIR